MKVKVVKERMLVVFIDQGYDVAVSFWEDPKIVKLQMKSVKLARKTKGVSNAQSKL